MRVVLVGVDGLDPENVNAWRAELPTLSRFAVTAGGRGLTSVFPPDSVPAWCSIFTGVSPAEHGITGYMDYMMDRPLASETGGHADALRGKTFWDYASGAGRSVDIINPFLAYPAWQVNGSMISGPVALTAPVMMSPDAGYVLGPDAPVIGGILDTPDGESSLPAFVERTRRDIVALTDLACSRLEDATPDLLFVTFLQLDRIQHFLWRFSDPDDGTYPGPNPFEGHVREFYRLVDACVARIEASARGAVVMVVSDHGHGRRCERVLNVNEVLRRAGLLSSAVKGPRLLSGRYLLQGAKNLVLETAYRLGLEDAAYGLARHLPGRKALKMSAFMTGPKSLAELSNMSGTNPFGGVLINELVANEMHLDVKAVVSDVISSLEGVRLSDGTSPVLWAKPREAVYSGAHATAFPNVLFQLVPDVGVGWSVEAPLVVTNTMHRRISGGHRIRGYLGINVDRFCPDSEPNVMDVAPSVLTVLGVAVPPHLEGSSFVAEEI